MGRMWCQKDPHFLINGTKGVQCDVAAFGDPADLAAKVTATHLEVRHNTVTTITRTDSEVDLGGHAFDITYIVDATVVAGAIKVRGKLDVSGNDATTGKPFPTTVLLDCDTAPCVAQVNSLSNAWTGNAQVKP